MFDYRRCTLCTHINDYPQTVCLECTKDHECFELDEGHLQEEVDLGLMRRREAWLIRRRYKEDTGIPGQMKLPKGDRL